MNSKRFFTCFTALAATALPLAADTNPPASAPAVVVEAPASAVARVNGTEITRAQLDEAVQEAVSSLSTPGQNLPPEHKKDVETQVLNQMIGQQLLLEKSKSVKVDNIDAKVADQLAQIKKRIPDEKMYAEQLKSMNLTEDKLKQKIAEGVQMDALIDQEVRSKIQITPAEVKDFYDTHPQYFNQSPQVKASHILVMVPKDADDKVKAEKRAVIDKARERVVNGEDFAKVAAEVSEDPGSKTKGGDLGFFGKGQMVKPFEEAAFSLKTNEVSQVVTSQFGYHIIKVTDTRPASTLPLEQEKPKIEKYLKQQKVQQGVLAYIDSLRKEAKVEVLLK